MPDSESCSEESEESLPRGKSRRLSQTSLSSPNVTLDSSDDYSSSMNAAQQSSSPEDKETSTQPVNDSSFGNEIEEDCIWPKSVQQKALLLLLLQTIQQDGKALGPNA